MNYWEEDFSKDEVEQRLAYLRAAHKRNLRRYWLVDAPLVIFATGAVVLGAALLAVKYIEAEPQRLYLTAAIFWCFVVLPPLKMLKPAEPSPGEAAHSLMLNKIGAELKRKRLVCEQ